MTGSTGIPGGNPNRLRAPFGRFFKRNVQIVTKIGPPIHLGAGVVLLSSTAAENIAENIAEGVCEIGRARAGPSPSRTGAHVHIGVNPGMAETVVSLTLVFIRKDFVGFFDFFEFLFGRLAVGITVRMVLHRQFAISFFDFVIRSVFGNP